MWRHIYTQKSPTHTQSKNNYIPILYVALYTRDIHLVFYMWRHTYTQKSRAYIHTVKKHLRTYSIHSHIYTWHIPYHLNVQAYVYSKEPYIHTVKEQQQINTKHSPTYTWHTPHPQGKKNMWRHMYTQKSPAYTQSKKIHAHILYIGLYTRDTHIWIFKCECTNVFKRALYTYDQRTTTNIAQYTRDAHLILWMWSTCILKRALHTYSQESPTHIRSKNDNKHSTINAWHTPYPLNVKAYVLFKRALYTYSQKTTTTTKDTWGGFGQ